MFDNGRYYRGIKTGNRINLDDESENRSPFQYVYDLGDRDLRLNIKTDIEKLLQEKKKEEWQQGTLDAYHNNEYNRSWKIKVRARGKSRKDYCHLPPLKIDFAKSTLKYLGFSSHDDLKLVIPCDDERSSEQNLLKEYLCYKLYEIVDSLALGARLIDVVLEDDHSSQKYEFAGFCLEDDIDYEKRVAATVVNFGKSNEKGKLTFDNDNLIKLNLFQLMILNEDWNHLTFHNIKNVRLPEDSISRIIPYDFDFAGIVSQPYAEQANKVAYVKQVTIDRLLQNHIISSVELENARDFFLAKKESFLNIIDESTFMKKKNRKEMKTQILEFYKLLENESEWIQLISH